MPKHYMFQGFVSFKLFGHIAPNNFKSQLLLVGDCVYEPGERALAGRANLRATAATQRAASRASDQSTCAGNVEGKVVPLQSWGILCREMLIRQIGTRVKLRLKQKEVKMSGTRMKCMPSSNLLTSVSRC